MLSHPTPVTAGKETDSMYEDKEAPDLNQVEDFALFTLGLRARQVGELVSERTTLVG